MLACRLRRHAPAEPTKPRGQLIRQTYSPKDPRLREDSELFRENAWKGPLFSLFHVGLALRKPRIFLRELAVHLCRPLVRCSVGSRALFLGATLKIIVRLTLFHHDMV